MIVYVETSAAAKLISDEDQTAALMTFLDDDAHHVLSSALLETELRRAAARERIDQQYVTDVINRLEIVDLDRAMFSHAGLLPGVHLRSLDALHIAAAMAAGADLMVTYDQRQIVGAAAVGLSTFSPCLGERESLATFLAS